MGRGVVAEIEAGAAEYAVRDHGLGAIRPGDSLAEKQLGNLARRRRFAAHKMPIPKTPIDRETFRRIFHLARQFAGAREGRAGSRRPEPFGPEQRLPVATL